MYLRYLDPIFMTCVSLRDKKVCPRGCFLLPETLQDPSCQSSLSSGPVNIGLRIWGTHVPWQPKLIANTSKRKVKVIHHD